MIAGWSGTSAYPLFPGELFPNIMAGNNPDAVRRVDAYANVNGLVIPRGYTTIMVAEDQPESLLGAHIIINPSFSNTFDPMPTKRPADAEVVKEAVIR